MRILNTSGRVQTISGVGTWEIDGTLDLHDQAVVEGVLKNPYFEPAADQPEDKDTDPTPVEASKVPVSVPTVQETAPVEAATVVDDVAPTRATAPTVTPKR